MSARMRLMPTASAAILAIVLMLGAVPRVSAVPIAYNTYGSIDSFGVQGEPVLIFQGVPYGTLTTGNSFDIGKFTTPDSITGFYPDRESVGPPVNERYRR